MRSWKGNPGMIEENVTIGNSVQIDYNSILKMNSVLGDGVTIKHNVIVGTGVVVGNNTFVGPGSILLRFVPNAESRPCSIGANVFIGAGVMVLPGVKVCDDAIIGAGSIVTKDISEPGTYIGNPARLLEKKERLTNIGKYCIIDDPVSIDKTASIFNYVHIRPGVAIGAMSEIRDHCFLAESCDIGSNTTIFQYSNIGGYTKIGDNCFIGPRVTTTNDKEITYPKDHNGQWERNQVVIEGNVRIGAGAIILPGVILAHGTRIGAGSVVTKSTEAGETYIGNPAIKKRRHKQ